MAPDDHVVSSVLYQYPVPTIASYVLNSLKRDVQLWLLQKLNAGSLAGIAPGRHLRVHG